MEKRDSIFDAVISYFKSGKRARIILILALVGAVILIFGAFSGGDTKSEDEKKTNNRVKILSAAWKLFE